MADTNANAQYLIQALLSKLASLSSGMVPQSQGLSAQGSDIELPNQSGVVDPRIAAASSPAQRAVSNFRTFAGRK